MPCYHPLIAIKTGDEKKPVKILGSKLSEINNIGISYDKNTGEFFEPFRIPCGKCIGCRLDYSRTWADRCVMESLLYPEDYNCWITLTYSDENLPQGQEVMPTLFPRDVQLFLKRLRIKYERSFEHSNIRFYLCGEYGDTTKRPHYHIILFNCPIFDKYEIGHTKEGYPLYNSEVIDECWNKGHAVIANFTWQTAAYTARYVTKKLKGPMSSTYYEKLGIEPEFVRMSRKPGIASGYYEQFKDKIYSLDEIVLPAVAGKSHVVKPPRFFDCKLKIDDPLYLAKVKSRREKLTIEALKYKLDSTDLNEETFLINAERKKLYQVKALKRNL